MKKWGTWNNNICNNNVVLQEDAGGQVETNILFYVLLFVL